MPNLFEMLRLRNIFGQPPITAPGIAGGDFMPPNVGEELYKPKTDPYGNISFGAQDIDVPQVMSPQPDLDISQRMREIYTPESGASEQFNRVVGGMPTREQYKPGLLRNIGAGLISLGSGFTPRGDFRFNPQGMEAGLAYQQQPFNQAMQDWKSQVGPAYQAASLERQTNVNERQMAYQTASMELREEAQRAKEANDSRRAKVMEDRAEVYRLKSLRGNFKFDFSGPEVLIADPTTGKVTKTGIATGSLSDADKMALQQENVMEQIGARGKQAQELEGTRQAGRESLAETRGWQIANIPDPNDPSKQIAVKINQITGDVQPIQLGQKNVGPIARPTTGAGARGESPAQTKVRQFNAAREFKQRNPELGKFITIQTGNNFVIKDPGGWSGPTPEQHRQIMSAVYGQGELPIQQPGRTNAGIIRQRSPSTGKIRESTDGGKTWRIVNQ